MVSEARLKSGQGLTPNILVLFNLNEFVIKRGLECLCNLCLIFKIITLFSSSAGSEVFILLLRKHSQSSSIFLTLNAVDEQIMIQFCIT